MKILIIEDEKMLALLMKKGLEENSFTVDISHDVSVNRTPSCSTV